MKERDEKIKVKKIRICIVGAGSNAERKHLNMQSCSIMPARKNMKYIL